MAKKVAISGYYGFKNFGDELILSILTKNLLSQGADVTVFSVDTEFTEKTYGVKAVKTFDPLAVAKTLFGTEVLISGGGSLFQDATSVKSVIYYSLVLALAQLLGKKTVIFAQGVGPLYSPISRFLVKFLFKRANFVSVRDDKSFELMKSWGINAKLVSDPVYSLEIERKEKENSLGVQLRSFAKLDEEFLQNLAYAVAKTDFPQVKVFSLQKTLDYEICEKFLTILHELAPEKEIELVQDNLTEELSKLDTLISMRFHALIVALKAGVKCSVINYDPKVQVLAEKYLLPLVKFTDNTAILQEKMSNSAAVQLPLEPINLEI